MLGIYIHVPFCKKRCHYCAFYSTTFGQGERQNYVRALEAEMKARATSEPVTTVYFGGGTPSQLASDELQHIFDALHRYYIINDDAEITFECNPDDVTDVFAQCLVTLGVNRVSMGVQSFDDDMLRVLNRRHNSQQVYEAILCLHRAGLHNVSIDLMYGLPGQTMELWRESMTQALSLAADVTSFGGHPLVSHLSSYALSIEEGTMLYSQRQRGEIVEISDEVTAQMYDVLVENLQSAGFEHYEVSNFALSGFRSRHNSSYWSGIPYIGLGPGAHSYDGQRTRRWNTADLLRYIENPTTSYEFEHLSTIELYDELIMTRLRTADGLPLSALSPEQRSYLLSQARKYLECDFLRLTDDNRLVLTRRAIFLSDTIFADLMWDE